MSVTLLVSTHDRYRAAWKPFCHGLHKYWPDCPWPVRFMTNHRDPPCGKALKTGTDDNWTTMHRKALTQIQTKMFFFLHEDYWLTHPVDTKSLLEFAEIIEQGDADRIMLCQGRHTGKGTFLLDDRLNVYADKSIVRNANQAGLWRTSTFLSLLKTGESAWDFELDGNIRSYGMSGFLYSKKTDYIRYLFPDGALRRGRWKPHAKKYAIKEKLKIDFFKQPRDYKRAV